MLNVVGFTYFLYIYELIMKTLKFLFTAVILLGCQVLISAPAPPPSGGTTGPACWPPPCVPIDGGIIFLIVAGALYGVKKIYDSRKKTEFLS
jgi:hypothetical protein